jgi:hypothetical protein
MSGFRTEWHGDGWSVEIDNGTMTVYEPDDIVIVRGTIDGMCAQYPNLARRLVAEGVLRITHDD